MSVESTCENMDRKLPVLVARAVVASTTNKNATANNTLKDKLRFAEGHVVDAVNQACEIHVTIRVNVEKSNDLTISQSYFSTQKKTAVQKAMTTMRMVHQKKQER